MNAQDHPSTQSESSDELERAAETLERPLASVIGDYQEVGTDSKPTRGVFLLPNMITTGALFAGFYAVVAGMQQDFYAGSVAIFVAMVLDGLDGRIARLTNTTSAFGAEYDSMSDMVSFGVAPALLVFNWSLVTAGKAGWVAAFIYTACAALRLARFNTQLASSDGRLFTGLASPAAAALAAGSVWLGQHYGLAADEPLPMLLHGAMLVLLGFLMISNFPYQSFKKINLFARVPFVRVLLFLLVLGLVALNPPVALWTLFFAYALSGPVQHLRRKVVVVPSTVNDAEPHPDEKQTEQTLQ